MCFVHYAAGYMMQSTIITEHLQESRGTATNVAGAEAAVQYYNWLRGTGKMWEV